MNTINHCDCGDCDLQVTDCCEDRRPECEVTHYFDSNDEHLVTQCDRNFGCQKEN